MGLIIDTSALVALERARAVDRPLELDPGEIYTIPAIVWAEALVGVRLAANVDQAARRMAGFEPIRGMLFI